VGLDRGSNELRQADSRTLCRSPSVVEQAIVQNDVEVVALEYLVARSGALIEVLQHTHRHGRPVYAIGRQRRKRHRVSVQTGAFPASSA
jgi:hypothetical protein